MRRLEAVFFDIDDTLYSTSDFAASARRRACRAMVDLGLRADPEDVYRELCEVVAEFSSNYDRHFDKLLLRLPRDSWAGIDPRLLTAAAVIEYHRAKEDGLEPFPGVMEVLRELADAPVLTGVISQGLDIKQMEKLLRLGVHDLFDPGALFISEGVGIGKPNPKLWQRCCRLAGVAPEHALYVGDHPVRDIPGAKAAGLVTCRIRAAGRHLDERAHPAADHDVADWAELRSLLHDEFEWAAPGGAPASDQAVSR